MRRAFESFNATNRTREDEAGIRAHHARWYDADVEIVNADDWPIAASYREPTAMSGGTARTTVPTRMFAMRSISLRQSATGSWRSSPSAAGRAVRRRSSRCRSAWCTGCAPGASQESSSTSATSERCAGAGHPRVSGRLGLHSCDGVVPRNRRLRAVRRSRWAASAGSRRIRVPGSFRRLAPGRWRAPAVTPPSRSVPGPSALTTRWAARSAGAPERSGISCRSPHPHAPRGRDPLGAHPRVVLLHRPPARLTPYGEGHVRDAAHHAVTTRGARPPAGR